MPFNFLERIFIGKIFLAPRLQKYFIFQTFQQKKIALIHFLLFPPQRCKNPPCKEAKAWQRSRNLNSMKIHLVTIYGHSHLFFVLILCSVANFTFWLTVTHLYAGQFMFLGLHIWNSKHNFSTPFLTYEMNFVILLHILIEMLHKQVFS